MAQYHQGKYTPKNPQKYTGDPTTIVYRSSWELKFMNWCDANSAVLEWCSEETVIPYRCGTDGRVHRYFVDFKCKMMTRSGPQTFLIEIKPDAQTRPPQPGKRKTQRYLQESMTFIKNQSKWKYADQYCKDRGWVFKVITEKELGI